MNVIFASYFGDKELKIYIKIEYSIHNNYVTTIKLKMLKYKVRNYFIYLLQMLFILLYFSIFLFN